MIFHYWRSCLFSSCLRHFGCHLVYLLAKSRIITSTEVSDCFLYLKLGRSPGMEILPPDLVTSFSAGWISWWETFAWHPTWTSHTSHSCQVPSLCCHCHCQEMLICHGPQSGCRMFLLCPLHESQVLKVPLTLLIALCWILELDPF